ncbi:helix-turn-helix domain-containing protein [Serinicoccus sp. CNJ-927]|uniref:helix-turn-helix domain-containing protein n=1 Tax=Serinicoccus sp. CNJ-927 TaxID=1904970 RepID=UPI0009F923EF|nr:helix-turn-helix transcriptional regulator [Serinicoccus sp. CNJ-927]
MVRPSRPAPRELVDPWPTGDARDAAAAVAARLAVNLREAVAGRSTRAVAELTGVDRTTVAAILNGTTWPDLATVARLEHGLVVDLWPGGVAKGFGG